MQYARKLRKGDKVAIVSLSSGMLGEEFCSHNIEIGVKRLKEYGLEPIFMPNALKGIEFLKEHPEARAKDLKDAFLDDSIAGIICAIGGDDTYRLLPYLMEDEEFIRAVEKNPKLFTGFSDTTINHLMFYKLGLSTYYGPNFLCDLGEIADEMLPYSRKAFESYLEGNECREIVSSEIWYEEREDFSRAAIGTDRIAHKEERGFELLQGSEVFQGELLGGCLESLYDILTTTRYKDEKAVCEKYGLFPNKEEWRGKILFIETCEEKPAPELFKKEIMVLRENGVFDVVKGVLVGKPQDEVYYQEYKDILIKVIDNEELSIVYNVNFGHAAPRCILQYGVMAKVDMKQKKIYLDKEETLGHSSGVEAIVMNKYLCETEYIDYGNLLVKEKVNELRDESMNSMDYMKRAYLFVRDEITHTWDIKETVVSKKASDVLRNKTGICWTKSCLLAALLRANGIPAGISYQKLTRSDEDDREGYIIHALNTVYISELNRWIRLDARGNKENVHAEFSVDQEILAFIVRPEFGEIDYKDNHPDLDKRLCTILEESNNILQIHTDFEM